MSGFRLLVAAGAALVALASWSGRAAAVPISYGSVQPSRIVAESGEVAGLTALLTLDFERPVTEPTVLRATELFGWTEGVGFLFALDGTVPSPALGVLDPSGSFLIPTLFLRVARELTVFDLAVPNVTGQFDDPGTWRAFETSFQIDSGGPAGILTVHLRAVVPEPASALLVALGLGALASRRREGLR